MSNVRVTRTHSKRVNESRRQSESRVFFPACQGPFSPPPPPLNRRFVAANELSERIRCLVCGELNTRLIFPPAHRCRPRVIYIALRAKIPRCKSRAMRALLQKCIPRLAPPINRSPWPRLFWFIAKPPFIFHVTVIRWKISYVGRKIFVAHLRESVDKEGLLK